MLDIDYRPQRRIEISCQIIQQTECSYERLPVAEKKAARYRRLRGVYYVYCLARGSFLAAVCCHVVRRMYVYITIHTTAVTLSEHIYITLLVCVSCTPSCLFLRGLLALGLLALGLHVRT